MHMCLAQKLACIPHFLNARLNGVRCVWLCNNSESIGSGAECCSTHGQTESRGALGRKIFGQTGSWLNRYVMVSLGEVRLDCVKVECMLGQGSLNNLRYM